jgi:hypothetical protein
MEIPLERRVEAIDTLVIGQGPWARVVNRGQILDEDDEAVRLAPNSFRRPAAPILTREEVS